MVFLHSAFAVCSLLERWPQVCRVRITFDLLPTNCFISATMNSMKCPGNWIPRRIRICSRKSSPHLDPLRLASHESRSGLKNKQIQNLEVVSQKNASTYSYTHTHTHTHTQTLIQKHGHTHIHTRTHTFKHVNTNIHIFTHTREHMFGTHIYTRRHTHIHTHIHLHMNTHTYARKYTHVHTYTYTH